MGTLTTKARKNLPSHDFALSGRRFPVEDPAHARAALSRVSESLAKGNITSGQAATVRRRAHAELQAHHTSVPKGSAGGY
jgi:hypothetical protein